MLALFLDVYVARLTGPVTTADVAATLRRLDVHCAADEIDEAMTRNPGVLRVDGRWQPRRRRLPRSTAVLPAPALQSQLAPVAPRRMWALPRHAGPARSASASV